MAIPTMQHNTPSAGHISWGAFTIQLNGVAYSVPAASSNQRWVWWEYRNGSPVINAGLDVPSTLTDDDLVLFANKDGIGFRVQSSNFVDGELLVDGTILADAIKANQISTSHIVTAGLDAGVVKFGTMSGDRISVGTLDGNRVKARTLLTSALLVTDMENLLDNPYPTTGTAGSVAPGWTATANGGPILVSTTLPDGSTGLVFQITGNGAIQDSNNREIEVAPNDEFWVAGYLRKVAATTDTAGTVQLLGCSTTKTDGTMDYTSPNVSVDISTLQPGVWVPLEGSVKMPAKALKTRFRMSVRETVADGQYQFWGLQVRRKNNGKVIVDGSILANHIKAGEITATQIKGNTITSNEIATGAITADEIFAGAVTAAKVGTDVLVANEVFSRTGYFGTLTAEQLRSGSLDADVALLGSLGVGDITITPEIGIVVPSPKGDTVLRSDGTGSSFAGQVETDDLTVDGGLTVNGKTNNVNGSLSLANVVVPPTVAPTVSRAWPYTKPIGADTYHITESHDQLSWVALHWPSKTLKKYNKTSGALEATWDGPADWDIYSVAAVGSYYFMACRKISTSEVWLCRMSSTGTSFTALAKIDNLDDVSGWMAGVGRDEITGNVMSAYVLDTGTANAGKIRVHTWDANGNMISSELYDGSSDGVAAGDFCFGVGRGNWGANNADQVYINTGHRVRFYDKTTRQYVWWPGTAESPKGQTVTAEGKFVYVGYSTYRVYEWATKNGFNFEDPSITYAWYDSKDAGTGKHETTPSPPKVLTDIWPWSWIEVQTPAPSNTGQPDSPDSVAIYIDNKRQPDIGVGVTKAQFRTITAGAAAKTVNEFTGAGVASYPGEILSAATKADGVTPRLLMKGDGTGHWGDLTVDGNGKAVVGGDTGWIEVTAFSNMWENYGGSWRTAGYRKIGNRVFLKGLVKPPAGTITVPNTAFTLPAGFRPPADFMAVALYERITGSFDATGDGSKNTGTPNNSTTSHTHPITAYDISTAVRFNAVAGRIDVDLSGNVKIVNADYANTLWVSLDNISFLVD